MVAPRRSFQGAILDAKRRQIQAFATYDAQDPFGFLVSQLAHIEPTVIDIQYPDIQYPSIVPIDTSAMQWARTITYFSRNKTGEAEWFSGMGQNMPHAESFREKHDVTIEMSAIGYGYNLEEVNQAMMVGTSINNERAMAARRAMEEFIDKIVLEGSPTKDWEGLMNSSAASKSNAPNGASGNTEWSEKTADEILADINNLISGMWTDSRTIELADTLLLPPSAYSHIVYRRIPDTPTTVMNFVKEANTYTAKTGSPLMIRELRGLENAAAGGAGRALAYRRSPEVLKLHMPMPHMFLPVWQTSSMMFEVPGIARIGGLEIRRPGAVRYLDMITT